MWIWALLIVIWTICNYFVITTIVDIALMGALHFKAAGGSCKKEYFITRQNRIDTQTGFMCSGYSSAYVLRHHGIEAAGEQLYENMPNKMRNGYTYPKGIQNLFQSYGFQTAYCRGSLNALKKELNKGSPVIVMVRVVPGKRWLHYVPVVGYDETYVYLAESLPELRNCDAPPYNRKITNKEFMALWNTAMLKQPFYKNTYYVIERGGGKCRRKQSSRVRKS